MDRALPFYHRHPGPWQLVLTRPVTNHTRAKHGFATVEWLPGAITIGEDVELEARALLDDKRDTIALVHVWDVSDRQFVGGFRSRPTDPV